MIIVLLPSELVSITCFNKLGQISRRDAAKHFRTTARTTKLKEKTEKHEKKMSSQGRRIIITPTKHSPLPTCNPNLMPFHIGHTGPAAVSMFLRVEKMQPEEEQNEKVGVGVVVVDKVEEEEVVVKEGEDDEKVDEAKVDCIPTTVIHDSVTKDAFNLDPSVKDEDVEMKSSDTLLLPSTQQHPPIQVQDTQLDIEMVPPILLPSTQTTSSSPPPIPLPSSPSSNKTLPGPIQAASASTSTLVASESLSSLLTLTTSSFVSSSSSTLLLPPSSSSVLKDIDKRFTSSFRGRTIHGLTVDLPIGYTGLVLQGDPQPTATAPGLNAEVKSGFFEGEDEREEEEEVNSGTKGGRRTRSKGKGKVKEPTKKTAAPKGRLARTAAPKRTAEPEVITVDDQDQEMAEPKAPTTEPPLPAAAAAAEMTDCHSQNLELTNDDTDCLDNDLDEGMPLRKLIPQCTFSSITLWHADRAVDETRDEYYRTLTEWMALNHEVSICKNGYLEMDANKKKKKICRFIEQTCRCDGRTKAIFAYLPLGYVLLPQVNGSINYI